MFGFSGWEIPAIILLALLFFGGKKLPELAQGLGKSMRAFKEEVTKDDTDEDEAVEEVKIAKVQKSKKSKGKSKK